MGICRLCGLDKKLGKSHVIPEAFFRAGRTGANSVLISANSYPKKAPVGVYDETILCHSCEELFGFVDSYGTAVLLKDFDALFQPLRDLRYIGVRQSYPNQVDQDRLLRFFVATLWRASVSTHPFFKRVQLGRLEESAAKSLDEHTPINPQFSAVLSCWGDTNGGNQAILNACMDPFHERWDGVNAYRFYFGKVVVYIKADGRPFPHELHQFALMRHSQVTLIDRDFMSSSDFSAMRSTVGSMRKRGSG